MRAATLSVFLCACAVKSGADTTPVPPGPPQDPVDPVGVPTEEIRDDSGRTFLVFQGRAGEPGVVGCADGRREAFVDQAAFPTIAGCLAAWSDKRSMRAPATGKACGDDAGECAVPADACAPGWHVCGASGQVAELQRLTPDQCEGAGGGRYSAAMSHCTTQSGCEYGPSYECFDSGWCSEPVCCGGDCGEFGSCADGVWPGKTHIPVGTDQGCGQATSQRAGGVLCCK